VISSLFKSNKSDILVRLSTHPNFSKRLFFHFNVQIFYFNSSWPEHAVRRRATLRPLSLLLLEQISAVADPIASVVMLVRPEPGSANVDPTVLAVDVARPRKAVAVDPTASAVMPAKLRAATANVVTIVPAVDAVLASKVQPVAPSSATSLLQ